jgi:hypothetical protein
MVIIDGIDSRFNYLLIIKLGLFVGVCEIVFGANVHDN